MQSGNTPIFKEIVLAGGGHSHALLIRQWGMSPLAGVRLTLVSPQPVTPYSGMLPGLVAGHYIFDDIHIDLVRLCHWAGVRFIQSEITGIEPAKGQVLLRERPALDYDVLSIDTGSTPDQSTPGVAEHAVSVKPIAGFWQRWQSALIQLRESPSRQRIAMVGGGAGSVEIILAMAWACSRETQLSFQPEFHLVYQTESLLPGYPGKIRKAAENACRKLGVHCHNNFRVSSINSNGLAGDLGQELESDHVFWCTQAGAPEWPAQSGLACDEKGFIKVDQCLQSVSHPGIFAAGDIAHMTDNPRPKAGVYAVRQGPYLFENLRRWLLHRPLEIYRPQGRFLSLLALGGKTAAGNRGIFSFRGGWVWHWKDRIDRKFMTRLRVFPKKPAMSSLEIPAILVPESEKRENLEPAQRCAGCGAKVGPVVLSDVLREFDIQWQPEDASVLEWPAGSLVQSVDSLRAPFDDPWLFGRIAVFHALNDLLAMNATPHSIQVALSLPFAGRKVQHRELRLLMQGVLSACRQEEVKLLGGHSSEGSEVSLSITANGIQGNKVFPKQGVTRGEILVTNKALGTGIILAGHMTGLVHGRDLSRTLQLMNTSNSSCKEVLARAEISCCTDISGFGLLGHLTEMLGSSGLDVKLDPGIIPIQEGVEALVRSGIYSSIQPQNEDFALSSPWAGIYCDDWRWSVMLDPQTSGGLLAAVKADSGPELEQAGFRVIGRIL